MNILVTGGAGYIGSTLVPLLLADGHRVRVLDSLLHGGESLLGAWSHPSFECIRGEICSRTQLRTAVAGMEAVVHLAAIVGDPACSRQPDLARAINLDASLALIEESQRAGVSRFLFASTCSNYGKMKDANKYVDEETELSPVSLYAETKVAVEKVLLQSSGNGGWCPTPMRFATIFGVSPRMRFDLTVNEFTMELLTKKHLTVFGEQFWRPYVHVRDAVRGIQLVLKSPAEKVSGCVFNVGSTDQNFQKQQLVEMIRPYAADAAIEFVHKTEDPRDYRVSFSRITDQLGFTITRTVADGIEEIAHLVRSNIIVNFGDREVPQLNLMEKLAPIAPATACEFIPLIVPEIHGNEWKYIKECLDTNWVSSVGGYVDRFEKMVAEQAGTKYAIATVNGTAALHIALLLAGIQADDEVVVSSLTFIAPANAIRYVSAWPVFIDAEPRYWQINPAAVVDFLDKGCHWDGKTLRNRRTGRRVKAILPVHILGHSVDLDPILAAAAKYSLPVIEDATEGLGARYRGKNLGSLGQAGCFSFNGNKIITTGSGGMLVTNDAEWAARARYLTTQAKDDQIEYVHNAIGYNYRLTNLLAAMGCAQMEQLNAFVETKRQIARRYEDSLTSLPGIHLPEEADWAFSSFWMYTVLINEKESRITSRDLIREMAARKIQTRPLWQPIHQSPAHNLSDNPSCPNSDMLYQQAISLPCSVGLTRSDQRQVIKTISDLLGK